LHGSVHRHLCLLPLILAPPAAPPPPTQRQPLRLHIRSHRRQPGRLRAALRHAGKWAARSPEQHPAACLHGRRRWRWCHRMQALAEGAALFVKAGSQAWSPSRF
jgi:hypothetical protein